jgi:CRISPR-associated protein Csc2
MNIKSFKDAIANGTVKQIKNVRQRRFTHILLLREVTAPARFTTDGQTANTTMVRVGDPDQRTIENRAVDLFYRKQPGAERRIAKSLQRDLIGDIGEGYNTDHMHPNQMTQNSPESVLFGSAAGNESVSQRSRVYYNTAYSLRDASVALRQNIQNASGDRPRNEASEGQGTWTPDFVLPGTMFPSVVTVDSATPEEVLFVLGAIARTTRYGAGESRGGNTTNHTLGVYTGRNDAPSNLEITRLAVAALADDPSDEEALSEITTSRSLDIPQVKAAVQNAFEELLHRRAIEVETVDGEDASSVANQLRNDDTLREVMTDQHEQVTDYIQRFDESGSDSS